MSSLMANSWEVFLLFIIPIGGGIPAGVVLANHYGMTVPVMATLYFVSDLVLACTFEPLMVYLIRKSHTTPWLMRFRQIMSQTTRQTIARFGLNPGPFSLVMLTLGTDPMTGRLATRIAGHGFWFGWTLTIIGDMLYFLLIMASTLWLNSVLGDGTWAAIIIMVAMIAIPALVRKLRDWYRARA